jgi:Fur family ferric uptake transcriptional regulator
MPETDASIDRLLSEHGLRRTHAARAVLKWLHAHLERSWTHAELMEALHAEQTADLDRVTLYRLLDRLSQAGLLLCHVDADRVRHYRVASDSPEASPRFECQACHRNFELHDSSAQLERAARSALRALESIGHHGLSVDLSVRGVCADCTPAGTAGRRPA